jgi:uncharacterized membrane protein YhaH (DUF805 family)
MTLSSLYFGTQGRIGRLGYLGGAVLLTAAATALNLALMAGFQRSQGAGALIVAMLLGVVFIVDAWACIGLTSKRLRDLGIAGVHALWIVGIGLMPGVAAPFSPTLALATGAMTLVAAMALIVIPGQKGPNAYGPTPGARPGDGLAACGTSPAAC